MNQKKAMDPLDRQDCEIGLARINEILNTGIFHAQNHAHLFRASAFIELMILLRDLLAKVEKYGAPLTFSDDVLVNDYVKDISSLIIAIRDACCHQKTFKRNIDEKQNRSSFMVAYGKSSLIKTPDIDLSSDYEDDFAFFYGSNRIYFGRHILRSLREIEAQLAPYLVK